MPDIPALVGLGKTGDEGKADFMKYFPDHLESWKKGGLALPTPRSFAEVVSKAQQVALELGEDLGEPREWLVEVEPF